LRLPGRARRRRAPIRRERCGDEARAADDGRIRQWRSAPRVRPRRVSDQRDAVLREQIEYLREASPFYAARLGGGTVRRLPDLAHIALLTKDELREGQRAEPPFGPHLCAPPDALVRMHVTSGTTGDPVAIGLTRDDHDANSAIGGEAFRIAGVRRDDTIAHCLNYAL